MILDKDYLWVKGISFSWFTNEIPCFALVLFVCLFFDSFSFAKKNSNHSDFNQDVFKDCLDKTVSFPVVIQTTGRIVN